MTMSHEEAHDMQLDAHKSAVAKAYGLAAAGYNKPALKFFSQGAEALVDFAGHIYKRHPTTTCEATFFPRLFYPNMLKRLNTNSGSGDSASAYLSLED